MILFRQPDVTINSMQKLLSLWISKISPVLFLKNCHYMALWEATITDAVFKMIYFHLENLLHNQVRNYNAKTDDSNSHSLTKEEKKNNIKQFLF